MRGVVLARGGAFSRQFAARIWRASSNLPSIMSVSTRLAFRLMLNGSVSPIIFAAGADFVEAEPEGFLARALLLGDAPAQIHLDEFDLAFAAEAAQSRPALRHQFLALPDHVEKGRGHKYADGAVVSHVLV